MSIYSQGGQPAGQGSRAIESAIEIGWNPNADQALQRQAFEFLNQLRTDSQAWQVCTSLFTRTPRRSEVVRLVSLEIINNAVNALALDHAGLLFLKNSLIEYIRQTYGGNPQEQVDPAHLQNKLTQTLTNLFVALYKDGWETFIDDFLALAALSPDSQDNNPGVVMYLRIIGSIHDEIADLSLSRQANEPKRNSDLKDLVRVRDMQKIAKSWRDVLAKYGNRDDNVVEMTLKVIGKWVSWTEISLVINQEMLNLLLPLIGRTSPTGSEDKVRDTAVDTLTEIVAKKMKASDKTDMIVFLNLREIISQLLASPPLNDFKGTPRYDTDLAEAVAKLLNTIMADVVRVLEDNKVENDTRGKAEQLLRDFLPSLLRLFTDEFDEICSTVIPSLTDLLTFLRKVGTLPPAYAGMLPPILNAIVSKMRYDETSSWGNEDEQTDEAEFQELRKRLQILQKSVAAVDQDLYIEFLSNLVGNMFSTLGQQGSHMDWRDIDLALHEIYLFGELALPNAGIAHKSQPNAVAVDRLGVMMSKLVESGIANYPHPAILLQYMEICVRYYVFFETQQRYIPQVLENFVRLVHHEHVRIRTRSWYLFLRFVKQLRAQVGNVAKTVIESISDLLPIKAEMPANDADDDMSSDESDHSADAVFNSQLYLFEAIGCISSTAATPAADQAAYAHSVMAPLFEDMRVHLPRAKAGDAQAILQIHHIVMALGTLASGFADSNSNQASTKPPPPKVISDEFSRAAEAILIALNELNSNGEIRAACRSAFSRLLGVLGAAVLPQLPQWIEGLLSRSSSKDEMAMFLRLLEQVVYNFKGEIYTILDLLLTPLLERVFVGLSEPISGTDDEIQLQELRREYVSFVQVILANELGGVLVSAANQGIFDSLVASIITISKTIIHANLGTSRTGFNVLTRMAAQWGGPDVATVSESPTVTGAPAPAFQGFDQFMMDRFHTACWDVLQDPNFKPFSDAQTRQILNEVTGLQQTIYTKIGDAFIRHLQSVTLPPLGIDGSEFVRVLTTATDRRVLTTYVQNLLKNRS
ncbi:armadillo-type protein [Lasiosphaeria miniovina]|uniref:Exportin-T n=1 Tax=Lasiosphaeria miniovina TaxID=1954250 RepID=A0AA40A4I5_9PEZI|nr:armadillo-type protein [Lasiosphaeria miniovina]KAK0709018.1 armadillo-type protein [Lasiosphaeria miniovina]